MNFIPDYKSYVHVQPWSYHSHFRYLTLDVSRYWIPYRTPSAIRSKGWMYQCVQRSRYSLSSFRWIKLMFISNRQWWEWFLRFVRNLCVSCQFALCQVTPQNHRAIGEHLAKAATVIIMYSRTNDNRDEQTWYPNKTVHIRQNNLRAFVTNAPAANWG